MENYNNNKELMTNPLCKIIIFFIIAKSIEQPKQLNSKEEKNTRSHQLHTLFSILLLFFAILGLL